MKVIKKTKFVEQIYQVHARDTVYISIGKFDLVFSLKMTSFSKILQHRKLLSTLFWNLQFLEKYLQMLLKNCFK